MVSQCHPVQRGLTQAAPCGGVVGESLRTGRKGHPRWRLTAVQQLKEAGHQVGVLEVESDWVEGAVAWQPLEVLQAL